MFVNWLAILLPRSPLCDETNRQVPLKKQMEAPMNADKHR